MTLPARQVIGAYQTRTTDSPGRTTNPRNEPLISSGWTDLPFSSTCHPGQKAWLLEIIAWRGACTRITNSVGDAEIIDTVGSSESEGRGARRSSRSRSDSTGNRLTIAVLLQSLSCRRRLRK